MYKYTKFEKEWWFEHWWNELTGNLACGWAIFTVLFGLLVCGATVGKVSSNPFFWVLLVTIGGGFIVLPVMFAIPWARKLSWTDDDRRYYKSYAEQMEETAECYHEPFSRITDD